MIIIEGMDGGGKTHLAKQLSKKLDLRVRHFGPPPKSYREFYSRCVRSTFMFGRRIIQDRCPFVSEVVYGSLREDVPEYNPWMKERIAVKQLTNEYLNPIVIHCRPIGHYLHHPENYDKDEYLSKIKKNWPLLQTKYDMLMRSVNLLNPVFTYDWTRSDVNELLGKVKERVNEKLRLIESLLGK